VDETTDLLAALPLERVSPADKICLYTALAQAALHKGNRAHARELAGHASQMAVHAPPTAQYSFPGYSGLAQVYLALWEASTDEPPAEREALQKLARQACQSVHVFARSFPAGQPYDLLWHGLYYWLDGNFAKANATWQKCLTRSQQLATPYEQGLAHFEIGRHQPTPSALRDQHLTQAVDIFMRLGATRDTDRVLAARRNPQN
jgi:hypothetical protein